MENSIGRKSVKFRAQQNFFLIRSVFLVTLCLNLFLGLSNCSTHTAAEPQDGKPQDYHHHLFSRAQRIQARVTREVVHSTVRGSQRHQQREKREIPLSSTIHPDGGHVEKITVTLPLDGKSHVLDLQLNRDLIPKGYFERTQRENKTVVHRPSYEEVDVCHYHGKIRGHPQSWAALSTCDDVIRGAVFDGDQLHYIEPVSSSSSSSKDSVNKEGEDENKDLLAWDLVHLKHAQLTRNLSCGHVDHAHDDGHPISLTDSLYGGLKNNILDSSGEKGILKRVKRGYSSHEDTRVPYNSNAKSRYVELVIVVDNKKYKELGGDLKAVRRRTKDIASIVNSLYAPLNIFIALVGMVVWSESDEITIKANGDETLASFLHYRKERLLRDHPNDNAQLLTAVEFENGVVGKAMQGPICSYKYSGGVNSDFKNNVIGVVATTVAHELGHNFGLSHDTESCTCPSSNNRCIMAASASSNRTMHWSSCSLKDFAYAFDHGMDYCLRNKPESLYDGPTCGNGFTEPGEECDCGLAEHCENPCCDANTCMIHLNATCASGTCCDMETCHVKAGGTICREANKLCDLPEYCTGESEFCPEDVTKMDGLTCDTPSGQAYCFNGECRTHTDQCRLLWGPSGNNSNDLCYQKNANGSRHAHCGYNLTTEKYARCQSEDVKCGILHCQMNSEKLEFGYESVSILASFFVNAGGKIHPCRSVIVDFGLSDINPGMVPDGAKCGEDKMCVNQKCVPVGSILGSKVPVCDHDCSGQGVCNSKGHCHCDDGYGGTYCEASGYGGSVDSGPARDPYGTSRFFKILYVTFLGFIPLIAIITFYIYYAGDYFKKLCFSVITLQAFNNTNRSTRYNNKPSSNGTAGNGTGLRSRDISSPTSQNHSNPTSPPGGSSAGPGTGGEDFFGQYKGFSLSPIKSSPVNQQRSGGGGSTSSPTGSNSHNNNNNEPVSQNSLPNGSIQSETNANVFYSSVPKQTETLVGNSDRPNGFRLPNGQTSFLQGAGVNRSVTRVSWAQPIASPLPVSPGSEDESANSDTPLYENTGAEKGSPKIQKLSQPSPVIPGTHQQTPGQSRPASGPSDALEEMKRFYGGGKAKEPQSPTVKKESPFGSSTSAFSRLAAAIPFVRSSFRLHSNPSSNEDNSKATAKGKNLPKKGSRGNLEISKPILQSDAAGGGDQVDSSSPRYANVPVDEPTKKPALKNVDRVRAHSPPPVGSKPIPKVQRAHSMIQPSSSSNRNSIHGSNGNYNSLRRARPSVPPPKPPEAPPPPPPTYMSSFSEAKSKFLTQQALKNASSPSPPPVPPPNAAVTAPVLPADPSPKGLRNSIGKFTFGANRSRSSSPAASPANKPASILSTTPPSNSLFKAPIAKVEELNSPSSPPSNVNKKSVAAAEPRQENIYDTIDEGMVALALNKKITPPTGLPLKKKSGDGGSSSGDSSPTAKKSSRRGSEEKIETLSTGSSESNNGGLLSEIILEIQQRNKESIYNSVDRRKQRREKKAAAANSTLMAERTKPEITTPKPTISTLSSMSKLSSSPSSKTSSPNSRESTPPKSSFSPNSSRRYVSPLTNQSFSFYKKPTGPGSGPPPGSPSIAATTTAAPTLPVNSTVVDGGTSITSKPKVVLNPTVVSPPPPSSSSSNTFSSRPQSTTSLLSNLSSPRVSFSSTFSRSSVSPPVTSATKAPPVPAHASPPVPPHATPINSSSAAKPTCAVNGVPKAAVAASVASSPSYVAKINYFSNLSQAAANTPMKPVNSIPAPSKGNAAKEIIYAPSNVDLSGNDGCHPGDRSHYAATIRRSRPQYYNNKDLEGDLNDANSNPVTDYNAANKNKQGGTLGRKPMGIYGSLGRKVATPVIRSNSIEKEKREARSRESTPETTATLSSSGSNGGSSDRIDREAVVAAPSSTASSISGSSPQIGYKPFNPYLNRQLTFSTFRPSTGGGGGAKNSPAGGTPNNKTNNTTTASTNGSGAAVAANGKCAVSSKPVSNGVGVTSPVQLRSPNRLVK